ncbi:MAG: N-acetyltransferase, partial [Myxococcales bacterium]|nr:N-acetyltransferase [Myxococcales bacterium]
NIRVETSSQDEYTAATRFYRRQGFEERGRIPDFYRIGEDLLTFVKRV